MDKAKVVCCLFLLTFCLRLASQPCGWERFPMDGHRTVHTLAGTAAEEVALLADYGEKVAALKETVGFSSGEMRCGLGRSRLGDWVTDVILAQGTEFSGIRCDAAILNAGGIRADMPCGDIYAYDIMAMFPFRSRLAVVTLTGARIREILDSLALRQWQPFAGMKIRAGSSSITEVTVGGEPLVPDRAYRVVTNTFLLTGGDGFYLKSGALSCEILEQDMYSAVMEYLRHQGTDTLCYISDDRLVIEGVPGGKAVEASDAGGGSGSVGNSGTGSACLSVGNSGTASPSGIGQVRPVSQECVLSSRPARCRQPRRLTILHTNDTHSNLEPLRFGEYRGWGGIAERAALIDSVRRADGPSNVLLVDAGDFFQGTPYFRLFGGDAEIKAMNLMRYDVAVMGNHEWDNGADALALRLKKARFRTVLCNYSVDNKSLTSRLKPYVIIRRGGMKVGLIGALTDISSSVDKSSSGGLRYHPPVDAVNKWALFLKERKGCDCVVVLSHCGLSSGQASNVGDVEMVPLLRNVDLIIGGHSHTDLRSPVCINDADGKPVTVVTAYCNGVYVGAVSVCKPSSCRTR